MKFAALHFAETFNTQNTSIQQFGLALGAGQCVINLALQLVCDLEKEPDQQIKATKDSKHPPTSTKQGNEFKCLAG